MEFTKAVEIVTTNFGEENQKYDFSGGFSNKNQLEFMKKQIDLFNATDFSRSNVISVMIDLDYSLYNTVALPTGEIVDTYLKNKTEGIIENVSS